VLDQCLSFGEGPITAAAVREVLGLIDDEQYAETLRAVADRDTGAVFPLVEALVNSGADLAEFMTGTADLLRAFLMGEMGVQAEGLTDTLRHAIERARGKLQPSDVVRMLALLADAETGIRRSGSARLIVETLLLRWTLMDRVTTLEAVIAGAGAPGSPGEAGKAPGREAGSTRARDPEKTVPRASAAAGFAPRPAEAAPGARGELSLESLTEAWPGLIAAARERSILLGQALAVTTLLSAGGGAVQLQAGADQAVLIEGLQRQLGVIEELLAAQFGSPVKVRVSLEAPAAGPAARPKRLTDEGLRAERLDRLRKLDPALDLAANELDLEIVDDSPRSP